MKSKVQIKRKNKRAKSLLSNIGVNIQNSVQTSSLPSLRCHGFIVLLIICLLNLVSLVLCNEREHNVTRKYENESLIEAQELFEESTGMVWSQLLEDYVLR